MRCRKDYRDLTRAERDRFVSALKYLKDKGVIDSFATLHDNNFGTAHGGSTFLPWHREFLRRFEDELRLYDSRITIPFWDWRDDRSTDSLLWSTEFLGQFDAEWGLGRNLGTGSLPDGDAVTAVLAATPFSNFRAELEGPLHGPPHIWVGGVMSGVASPGDPVFYLHHCFVDMLWAQWQLLHPGEPFMPSGGEGGENEDEAMAPWVTTPGDMLDHREINSYAYPAGFEPDLPLVVSETASIQFNDVPEGETVMRAAVFSVDGCAETNFDVIAGPVVTSGPAGASFDVIADSITVQPDVDPYGRIWMLFTGMEDGDIVEGEITIRCDETGAEYTIPITANTVGRPTAVVAMALDRSNSMNFDSGIGDGLTRGDVLKFSAPPFVDVLGDDNAAAVFYFDHDPQPAAGVTPVNGAGRAILNGAIAGYAPNQNGFTSIGEAVAFAHDLLPDSGYDIRATVVLTDGKENHGDYDRRYISDVADMINERVYAIGLGTAENIEPAALKALCDDNDGYLLMTGDLSTDAYFRLAKYYQQILAGVTNNEMVLDPEGRIRPGQEHRIPFDLNETEVTASAVLLTPAPEAIQFFLETPDGEILQPAMAAVSPVLEFRSGSDVAVYRTSLPLPVPSGQVHAGRWHAVLRIDDKYYKRYLTSLDNYPEMFQQTLAHGVQYSFSVQAYSSLRLSASVQQDSLAPGAELRVRAVLSEYGQPLSARASVVAEVIRPDNTTTTLVLSEVEPGVFQVVVQNAMAGIYRFRILAEGHTLRGRVFTREQTLTALTWQGGNRLPPSSGGDVAPGRDRLCRLLNCLLKQKGVLRWLKRQKVDPEELVYCLQRYCQPPGTPGRDNGGTMDKRLGRLLRDEGLVQAVMEELRRVPIRKDDEPG